MEGVLEATWDGGVVNVCFCRIVGTDLLFQAVGARLDRKVVSLVRAKVEADAKDETRFVLGNSVVRVCLRAQVAFEAMAWTRAIQERIIT
jgi:hypothetical protein